MPVFPVPVLQLAVRLLIEHVRRKEPVWLSSTILEKVRNRRYGRGCVVPVVHWPGWYRFRVDSRWLLIWHSWWFHERRFSGSVPVLVSIPHKDARRWLLLRGPHRMLTIQRLLSGLLPVVLLPTLSCLPVFHNWAWSFYRYRYWTLSSSSLWYDHSWRVLWNLSPEIFQWFLLLLETRQ